MCEKTCGKCKIPKKLENFAKNKGKPDGYSATCKSCLKMYYENNKQSILERNKRYTELNKDKVKDFHKNYRKENREKQNLYNKEYYRENKEKCLLLGKNYKVKNADAIRKWINSYEDDKINNDPIYKLKKRTRTLIYSSFKRACRGVYKKGLKTEVLLGCEFNVFFEHIQSLFTEGMTLENYGQGEGKWNIDHKIPLATATSEEEIIKLNHYTNLQPMWAIDNILKSDKII